MDVIGADKAREVIAQRAIVRILERQTNETEEKCGVASAITIDVVLESRVTWSILVGQTIAILVVK